MSATPSPFMEKQANTKTDPPRRSLIHRMLKNTSIALAAVSFGVFPGTGDAAKTVLRLTKKDGVLQQYYDQPDAFPVCRAKLDYITFNLAPDKLIRKDGQRLFKTQEASIEIFKGSGEKFRFTGDEVVKEIRAYEAAGLRVAMVIIYHENWLKLRGKGGPWKEDIRIIAPDELRRVREAIAKSDLKSRQTVKLVQLIGARVAGHRGDSWNKVKENPALMRHLENFDGIGIECHIGDHEASLKGKASDGPETLKCMADVARWSKEKDKTSLVFMGGGPPSYSRLIACQKTYAFLWKEMDRLQVNRKDPHLLYFRQGARPGNHLPESSKKSLTHQMKWLIEEVR